MNHRPVLAILAGSLLFHACSSGPSDSVEEQAPIAVTVSTAGSERTAPGLTASGRLEAKESANISTRIMGHVSAIHVTTGQAVERGQLLVTISSSDLEAQRRQAEAGVAAARAAYANALKDLERFEELFRKNSASRKELDDITTRADMARAGLDAALRQGDAVAAQLAYARIAAPYAGKVTNVFLKEGEMANPGMPILGIEGIAGLQAVVMVPESGIAAVRPGMKAEVLLKSLGSSWPGEVAEVSSSSRNTGGQYLVKIDIGNPGNGVLSGMFVEAGLLPAGKETAQGQGALVIPASAMVRKGQLEGVWVVNDQDIALLRWLRLGRDRDGRVEVLSGLAPGERYVVSTDERLYNGAKVELTAN